MKVLEILLQINITIIYFLKAFNTKSKQLNLIKTNDDGIKYYDIYNTCFTKKELIKEYDYFKIKNTKKQAHGFLKN